MVFTFSRMAVLTAFILFSASFTASADTGFSDTQKQEMGDVIKEYLMENPEVIMEAVDAYRKKSQLEAEAKAEEKLKEHAEFLTGPTAPSMGKADAKITVVEFFDYNCGYCKKALPDVQAVLEDEKDVRVVFQEMPILGPSSMTASQWAMAAQKQDKYFDFHVALMKHRGAKNEESLAKLAGEMGLDVEQMKKDAASKEVRDLLKKSVKVAQEVGISGTPAFIVDGKLYSGYLGEERLKAAISNARKNEDG